MQFIGCLQMYLDERDNRTEEMQALRPNGFTEETVISDFPVRDKKTDPAHPPPQMAYTRGEKLHGWYKTVNRCTIREVKSARDASAESLNSKLKRTSGSARIDPNTYSMRQVQ